MSERVTTHFEEMTTHWRRLSKNEIRAGWNDVKGQGNKQARKGYRCVALICSEEDALRLTALFLHEFGLVSATYYDGHKLSLHYGQAGSCDLISLELRLETLVDAYRVGQGKMSRWGPLFVEEEAL